MAETQVTTELTTLVAEAIPADMTTVSFKTRQYVREAAYLLGLPTLGDMKLYVSTVAAQAKAISLTR